MSWEKEPYNFRVLFNRSFSLLCWGSIETPVGYYFLSSNVRFIVLPSTFGLPEEISPRY